MEGDKATDDSKTELTDQDLDKVEGGTFLFRSYPSATSDGDNSGRKKGNPEPAWKVEEGE